MFQKNSMTPLTRNCHHHLINILYLIFCWNLFPVHPHFSRIPKTLHDNISPMLLSHLVVSLLFRVMNHFCSEIKTRPSDFQTTTVEVEIASRTIKCWVSSLLLAKLVAFLYDYLQNLSELVEHTFSSEQAFFTAFSFLTLICSLSSFYFSLPLPSSLLPQKQSPSMAQLN